MEIKASFVEIVSVSDKALKKLNIFYRNCVFSLLVTTFVACCYKMSTISGVSGAFYTIHTLDGSLGSSLIIFSTFLFFRSLVKNDSLGNFDFNRLRHLDFSSNFVG